ncbi:MAG: sigma 54-interacting transcriptional regulator [Planctomycetota bacterium]
MLYEPDQLISAKRFDFKRTAETLMDVASRVLQGEACALGIYERDELGLVASQGVDPDGVFEDPRLVSMIEDALEDARIVVSEGVAGPSFPRAGGQQLLVVMPLFLHLRAPTEVERERRRYPPQGLSKPLGILVVAVPPGRRVSAAEVDALEALASHTGEALLNARLYRRSSRDELTDLYKRQELEQHLDVESTIARHTDKPVTLLMIDIDGMTTLNQRFGRRRGDRVIARVARLVRAQVRVQDACIRYGCDEYAVVLPGTDPDGAMEIAEKIRRAVEDYAGFGDGIRVTVSVGLAVFPYHAQRVSDLLRKADQTLFKAKQEGGNRTLTWHRQIPRHALRSDKLIGILTGNQAKDYRNVMLLLDTVVVVNSLLERRQVLGTLLDMMIQLSESERGLLYLEQDGDLLLEVGQNAMGESVNDQGVSKAVVERVHQGQVPVAILDTDDDHGELVESCRGLGLERVICLPLSIKGKQIGCMYFDSTRAAHDFEESDLIFMRALARELGNAIENARLYQENLEQKRSLEELTAKLAQKVQAQANEIADMERNLSQFKARFDYERIVGSSEAMRQVFRFLDRITDSDVAVLVMGETGTGKELIARSLHLNGPRRDGPFVSVHCGAITETLMESELFGHVRGAFTGADRDKQGFFEQADGGTIFLDEVEDMSPGMQRELLRVLQEGEIRRVGGKDIVKVDVRVISACNRDLAGMVKSGEFRQDLFYRLNVVSIELPPLRDRKEDIPLLVESFLDEIAEAEGRRFQISKNAMRALLRYDWPGNVRELQSFLRKKVLLVEGDVLEEQDVQLDDGGQVSHGISKLFEVNYADAKTTFAKEYLKSVLSRNGGNVTRASAEAGIVRSSFHKMMRKHGLTAKDFNAPKPS